MKLFLTSTFLVATLFAFAQTTEQKDSIINAMCKTLAANRHQHDTTRVHAVLDHLFPFVERFPADEQDELGSGLYIRLQRVCPEFKEILDRLDPPKGDWKVVDKKPGTKLNKKGCLRFFDYKSLSYIEGNGDTVALTIKDGYWIDRFKDGTFSKLKIHQLDACEFDIEFIESNNHSRKSFSKPGDKYRYQIIDQKEMYFEMAVQILGTKQFALFRLYY